MTLPRPAMTIHGALTPRLVGTPEATTNGVVMRSPTTIVQARDEADPMILTERDEMRLVLAKKLAVSNPRTMVSTAAP